MPAEAPVTSAVRPAPSRVVCAMVPRCPAGIMVESTRRFAMTRRLLLVPVLASLVLTGCINASTLIKVKPDGSGTLEQTVLMNAQAFRGMFSAMGADGKPAQVGPSTVNEAELKAAASKLGEGVTYVSSAPM